MDKVAEEQATGDLRSCSTAMQSARRHGHDSTTGTAAEFAGQGEGPCCVDTARSAEKGRGRLEEEV
ncbi:hypothetical protein EYF80_007649 [Liparis tanakae]|uniref:Uncharacterized protein n=1 Tax=Liparis tanakae TaxID=230148 RepID=A0A4Z2IXL9_9TELE|nr:hypothetical protein EYF80_007649 [Liparis tanakae]